MGHPGGRSPRSTSLTRATRPFQRMRRHPARGPSTCLPINGFTWRETADGCVGSFLSWIPAHGWAGPRALRYTLQHWPLHVAGAILVRAAEGDVGLRAKLNPAPNAPRPVNGRLRSVLKLNASIVGGACGVSHFLSCPLSPSVTAVLVRLPAQHVPDFRRCDETRCPQK